MTSRLARPPVKIVFTGGAGSGKTSVFDLIKSAALPRVATLNESAIDVIQGRLPGLSAEEAQTLRRDNMSEFQVIVAREQSAREASIGDCDVAILDRGIYDGIAYCLDARAVIPIEVWDRSTRSRYDLAYVFDTPCGFQPREETGRRGTRQDSVRSQATLISVYTRFGVGTVRVPEYPGEDAVRSRAEFVLADLAARGILPPAAGRPLRPY